MPPAMGAPAPPAPTPLDTGNTLLAEQPAQLFTAILPTPRGQRLALTIRTPSSTTTVLLAGADAKTWAAVLTREAAKLSSTGLIAANGTVPAAPGPGQ
jgi:hypothetical protein